jgi:abortive infection Abi-like protein
VSKDLISKGTRNEFREFLTGHTLREIEMFFDAGNLVPRPGHDPQVGGQRRSLVECYYANLDFTSVEDMKRLLAVYEEVMHHLKSVAERNAEPEGVTFNSLLRRMERDGFHYENGRFLSQSLDAAFANAPSLIRLTDDSIKEHVQKASLKISNGDPAGAITNAYTLVEEFLKQILRTTDTPFKESEGDIRALYKLVAGPLNLDPGGESLESYLKAILGGLQGQVGGLYELANKTSDRHARRYNPAPHHAKLAVNAAFTLCEFLLESLEYQNRKKAERAS